MQRIQTKETSDICDWLLIYVMHASVVDMCIQMYIPIIDTHNMLLLLKKENCMQCLLMDMFDTI